MMHWNEMHPYSAIHVVQMRGVLEVARLRTAINRTLQRLGLGQLTLDGERFTFQSAGEPMDCELQLVVGDQEPKSALVSEMERQLNLRFDHTRPFSPFRFLVALGNDSFYLGLVYYHPAADAESVVWLLQDIVTTYSQETAREVDDSLDLYPDSCTHLLRRHPRVVVRKCLNLPAQIRNLRQSVRVRYDDPDNLTNGFVFFSVAPDELRSLVAAAKSWGVSLNDLLLALLLKSLSAVAIARSSARKRNKLSLGCIVNLRPDLGIDSRRTFGLFLGSFTVTHEVPVGIRLRKLAEDLRQQTAPIKQHKLWLGTPLELGLARALFNFCSPARRKKFYAKYYPLYGGITNMNLNRLWPQTSSPAPLDYFRGVSTGPVTPLVLSATTFGDHLNIGLSYRTAVFSRAEIENLRSRFRAQLVETGENA